MALILRGNESDPPFFSRVGVLEFREQDLQQSLTQLERKVIVIV